MIVVKDGGKKETAAAAGDESAVKKSIKGKKKTGSDGLATDKSLAAETLGKYLSAKSSAAYLRHCNSISDWVTRSNALQPRIG